MPNRYQHRKGGTYLVHPQIGRVQTDTPLTDYTQVRVYTSEKDGSLWVRPVNEFSDGRFQEIPDEPGTPPPPLIFPAAMNADLKEALSTMLWTSGQICTVLRAGGQEIPHNAEEEQAHVLHWFICTVLTHGSDWRVKIGAELQAIADRAKSGKEEQ